MLEIVGLLRILRPAFGAPISGPAKNVKIPAFEASISDLLFVGALLIKQGLIPSIFKVTSTSISEISPKPRFSVIFHFVRLCPRFRQS